MKPERLTIRGMATFTQETVVDFSDLGLFAIVGPTGSGKTSIIDALCFVLYGRVARLGGRTIEPLISVGAKEMAISLTFSIRANTYRATRRVKRTKQGASTDEAALERLQPSHQMLASTADELTEAIHGLLGLTFDEFTKAVVLPQGAFANLLTATPKERQSLLSSLLGLGIYDQVRQHATAESKVAEAMANQFRVQVLQVGDISETDVTTAKERVATLEGIARAVDDAFVRLQAERVAYQEANQHAQAQAKILEALDGIGPPPQALIHHGERLDQLNAQALASAKANEEAIAQRDALGDAPDTQAAQVALIAHDQTEDLIQDHLAREANAKEWVGDIAAKKEELAPAQERLERARVHRATVVREHAAAQAVADLHEGDACPICANTLTADAPAFGMQESRDAIFRAESEYNYAVSALEGVKVAITNATTQWEKDKARASEAKAKVDAHHKKLQTLMTRAEANEVMAAAKRYQEQSNTIHAQITQSGAKARQDAHALSEAQRAGDRFITQLDQLRLGVAGLNPPPTDPSALLPSWQALETWAKETRPKVYQDWVSACALRDERMQAGKALRGEVDAMLAKANVTPGGEEPPIVIAKALTQATMHVERIKEQRAQIRAWKDDIDTQSERSAVYATVAKHLGARGFQAWLMQETTVMLVAGASKHMDVLSNGQYRLGMQGNDIVVIDRANANLTRSVRTLSGGETFLASLALALALADYIHHVAASPVAIDSLFIDEGFGSLDGTALDQAAQALEQLGATDRMVGVITHVVELADRLPARIQVQRQAGSSKIVSDV